MTALFRWFRPKAPRILEWRGWQLFDESGMLVAYIREEPKVQLWLWCDLLSWQDDRFRSEAEIKAYVMGEMRKGGGR